MPCASSSYFHGEKPPCLLPDPCRSQDGRHPYPHAVLQTDPRAETRENRRAYARTSPSSPCIEATLSIASKGQNFSDHRKNPELPRLNFLGIVALGPAPFDAWTLEKWPWESKSEFHGFLRIGAFRGVDLGRSCRLVRFIPLGINPFRLGGKFGVRLQKKIQFSA